MPAAASCRAGSPRRGTPQVPLHVGWKQVDEPPASSLPRSSRVRRSSRPLASDRGLGTCQSIHVSPPCTALGLELHKKNTQSDLKFTESTHKPSALTLPFPSMSYRGWLAAEVLLVPGSPVGGQEEEEFPIGAWFPPGGGGDGCLQRAEWAVRLDTMRAAASTGATPVRWTVKCFQQVRPNGAVVEWIFPGPGARVKHGGTGLAPRPGARDRVGRRAPAGPGRAGKVRFMANPVQHQATCRWTWARSKFIGDS